MGLYFFLWFETIRFNLVGWATKTTLPTNPTSYVTLPNIGQYDSTRIKF